MSLPHLDLSQTVAELRGSLSQAPKQLVDGFVAAVRAAPPGTLETVMATPVGPIIVTAIFSQMPRQLDRDRAKGANASVRWRITSSGGQEVEVYDLIVSSGRCRVRRGGEDKPPPATITVDGAELLRIAAGSSNPMQAYFKGRLTIAGDILAAAKLVTLFRMPGPGRARDTR